MKHLVIKPMKWLGSESGAKASKQSGRLRSSGVHCTAAAVYGTHRTEKLQNIAFVLPVFVLETKDV